MEVFVIMNQKGEWYGPGGWLEDVNRAAIFSPDDAALMLKVFPSASAIAAEIHFSTTAVAA
jgi:hypothetical protein